jgi:hypothetical protein
MPRLESIVRSDREPYFRFIADTTSLLWFLDNEKRGTVAFSLFFPPSLVRTMNYLNSRHDTDYLRPHWMPLVACGEFDPRALDLLAIKYMFCRLDAGEPQLPANWQAMGREHDRELNFALFRNTTFGGGIRIFCNWRTGDSRWQREDVLSAFSEGIALLEPAAIQGLPQPTADCAGSARFGRDVAVLEDRPGYMALKVTSTTPGIVFVPDNYDRGWHGTVNGIATPVIKIYGAYLGIPTAAGESIITMEYRDVYFWVGVAVSVLAAIGLCGYAVLASRRISRRNRQRPVPLGV